MESSKSAIKVKTECLISIRVYHERKSQHPRMVIRRYISNSSWGREFLSHLRKYRPILNAHGEVSIVAAGNIGTFTDVGNQTITTLSKNRIHRLPTHLINFGSRPVSSSGSHENYWFFEYDRNEVAMFKIVWNLWNPVNKQLAVLSFLISLSSMFMFLLYRWSG